MTNPFIDTGPPAQTKKKPGRKPSAQLAQRNDQIATQRTEGASLEELSQLFSISRERVRQICEALGVDNEQANLAYQNRKNERAYEAAEANAGVILMKYISGGVVADIARDLGLPMRTVQEILDEQVTDEIIAARTHTRTSARFPDADDGPIQVNEPRNDRFWTEGRVMDALVMLAKEHDGLLPSSTHYQKLSPHRDDLPSFPTVRNRLGRWSAVRVEVHRLTNNGDS